MAGKSSAGCSRPISIRSPLVLVCPGGVCSLTSTSASVDCLCAPACSTAFCYAAAACGRHQHAHEELTYASCAVCWHYPVRSINSVSTALCGGGPSVIPAASDVSESVLACIVSGQVLRHKAQCVRRERLGNTRPLNKCVPVWVHTCCVCSVVSGQVCHLFAADVTDGPSRGCVTKRAGQGGVDLLLHVH